MGYGDLLLQAYDSGVDEVVISGLELVEVLPRYFTIA